MLEVRNNKEYNLSPHVDEEVVIAGFSGKYVMSFALIAVCHLLGMLIVFFISIYLLALVIGSFFYFLRRLRSKQKKYGATGYEKEKNWSSQPKRIKYDTL